MIDRHPNTARRAYLSRRAYVRAMGALVALMNDGGSAEDVARFVWQQRLPAHVALSHIIEDASHPGTFAESVFQILAG